jgi:hypothetical protein
VPVSFVIFLRSFTACAALFVAACSDSRAKARAQLDPGHTSELRRDATRVYEEFLAKTGVDFIALKTTQWPESFKRFAPLRVGIYRDGVALALEGNASAEKGLHILPLQMNAIAPTGRAQYERMGEGVYWYALGK